MRPARGPADRPEIMAEFVLKVHDVDEAGKDFAFPVTRAWLARALADTEVSANDAAEDGRFEFRAQKQGADVMIHGHVHASLVADCARCLAEAPIDVDVEVGSLFTARSADLRPEPDEADLTPEDLEREFYTGDQIVLDDIVRENLLLEVPIKPLCDEECAGIPVPAEVAGPRDLRASGEGGVDPRFAPLLKLVGDETPTEE